VAADCTGGPSCLKGACGVGFADDGPGAVTLDPRASATLRRPLKGGLAPALLLSAATPEPRFV
jgi:hypothetical protein